MLLITGSTGRLGKEMVKLFPDALTPGHQELDVTDNKSVYNYMKSKKPDIVLHLAAMTNVVKCEDEKAASWNINVKGTINMVKSCYLANKNCHFVLMSTPCVFDGKRGMYTENDIPNPENFYGLTKLMAEISVLSSPLKTLVIRSNFAPREKWPHERAFTDRWGTYLFADDLAKSIKILIDEKKRGLIHVAGEEKMSMYELARITTPDVKPISYEDYLKNGGYNLTKDMTLDTAQWKKVKITK